MMERWAAAFMPVALFVRGQLLFESFSMSFMLFMVEFLHCVSATQRHNFQGSGEVNGEPDG